MKKIKVLLGVLSVALMTSGMFATNAFSYTITPADFEYKGTKQQAYPSWFDDKSFLYKAAVGNQDDPNVSEEGTLRDSYTTVFDENPLDPSKAAITYDLTNSWVDGDTKWLLVKDGNQDPAWYLFDISDWDGTETLELLGFWPQNGAISHVAIYGVAAPIPGAVWLLGSGILGLVGIRRKFRKG